MNYTPLLTGVDRNNSRGLFWPELSLRHVLDVAKRQWKCILLVVILAMSAACGILYSLTPLYTAELDLLFENRYHTMETDIEAAFAGRPQDEATVIGEMQVIISRQLATKVIEQLHLDEDPEFNVSLKGASALGRIANSIAQVAGLGRERNEESRMQEEKRRMQEIVDHFLDRLKVMKIKESRVVKVRFTAETPEKAARILNTLDSAYLVSRFEDRLQSSRFVADWLNEKIYDLRSRVDTAERKVAEYRQRHSLVSGEKNSLLKEQISALSVELTEASASRQAVEAKLQQARGLSQRRTEISSANRLFDSELVQQLRQREVELERQAAELGETLGSRHPRMIQLQAEREQLRSDLRGEINRLLDNLKYEVDVARARENALSADVQVAKNQIGDADQAGVGLRALEREAESSRLLLERFMGMLLQIGAEQDVQALFPAARVVSQAYEPVEQSFPRAIPTLMLALVGGLGLGTLLACAIDYAKNRLFVSAEQVEEATGVPVFGVIPLVNDKSGRGDVSPKLAEGTGSILWEAIGALYTRLLLWNKTENCSVEVGGEIKAVLLTSCHAGEGKSTIALSLARQQALCGRRVIVVDTDFRLSRVSTLTGANNRPGIAEVLAGSATLEEVIQQDRTSGTYVMPAGISEVEHSTMAGSAKIKALLAVLRAEYDLVIIDTIPIMAMAHAYVFAEAADVTLLIVRWAHTRPRAVLYGLRQLRLLGCNVSGIILSMVNLDKSQQYQYGDSSYYSKESRKYYART